MRFLRIDFLINDKLTQERELLSDLMGAPAPFSHDNNPFPAVFWMSLQCEKSRIEIQSRLFVILLIMICDYFTFTFFTTLYVPVVLPDTPCTHT